MKNVNFNDNKSVENARESHLSKKYDTKIQKSPFLRFSISLLMSLFVVYAVFQIEAPTKAPEKEIVEVIEDTMEYVPVFKEEQVVVKELKPEPKIQETLVIDKIKPVDNDTKIKEQVLKTTKEPKEVTEPFDPDAVEVAETVEEPVEVPFAFVEDAPVYPGCEKYTSKKDRKACMSRMIQKYVNRKFDTDLAEELDLDSGVKRISVLFIIDENGNITGIRSRGPHPKLEKEAERVIKGLPQMKPGKQQNKNVKVKYTLPIVFKVQ